jgi:putative acetyltransferase
MTVRDERPSDATSIRRVVERAFGRVAEADLVERLRLAGTSSISLVAIEDSDGARAERDRVIGHILFSPVTIDERTRSVPVLGLAPMAVPQNINVAGLEACCFGLG